MKTYRTMLSVLLGLVLLLQGFAVSATVHAAPVSMARMEAPAEPTHCHDAEPTSADTQASNSASCCDASCPDMARCLLGHMAVTASTSLVLPASPSTVPLEWAPAPVSLPPWSPLRPPISLRG